MSINGLFDRILKGLDSGSEEIFDLFNTIMDGEIDPVLCGGILTALRMKGETADEIFGAYSSMREHCKGLKVEQSPVVDTCGTGGDRSGTFNISTAVALALPAAGVYVAKHGNRSVSSKSGSADVLEQLGVRVDLTPDQAVVSIRETGFAFLFAPHYHPAMKNVVPVRRALGTRTIFNLLGPLTNPARVRRQVLGVFSPDWVDPLARVLARDGAERAFVVSSLDGLDEVSSESATLVAEIRDGEVVSVREYRPGDLGVEPVPLEDAAGGDARENARIILDLFEGKSRKGLTIVLLNLAFALAAAGRVDTPADGVSLAREIIESGAALESLDRVRKFD